MVTLKRQIKNKIYRQAKEYYEDEHHGFLGMCGPLMYALLDFVPYGKRIYAETPMRDLFPEFWNYKPETPHNIMYWWDTRNRDIRVEIFDKLIKETDVIQ